MSHLFQKVPTSLDGKPGRVLDFFVPKEKAAKDVIFARPCERINIRCQRLQPALKAILILLFKVAIQANLVYNKTKRNFETLLWYTKV